MTAIYDYRAYHTKKLLLLQTYYPIQIAPILLVVCVLSREQICVTTATDKIQNHSVTTGVLCVALYKQTHLPTEPLP